ncbi:hypothetical protein KC219_20575, partial [Mycobacterium tuberculosis]|nr:hypothetical protein [Mycobacterium tuberculosis]
MELPRLAVAALTLRELRQALQLADQLLVVPGRLLALVRQLGDDLLDAVDGLEDRRDRRRIDGRAVAELSDHRFRGMG